MAVGYLGIDVGTASVRAGVFDPAGRLLALARRPIATWREPGEIVEQSSDDIWAATTAAAAEAVVRSGLPAAAIAGVGFDATCSLVVLDGAGRPLAVGPSGEARRNVVVWMDHRAVAEAAEINGRGHAVLRHCGGAISPEMQTPKLLWLMRHLPDTYARAAHFFDLADFLGFRATGSTTRSTCTVTCKWTWLAHEGRWADDFFGDLGLDRLVADDHARIGRTLAAPGTAIGGLTGEAAAAMGLLAGTPVAASLIDAHAGALGSLGAAAPGEVVDPTRRMALVLGTSACCMVVGREPVHIDGLWGPHLSALLPGLWLTEGGQSAAGAAIDRAMRTAAAAAGEAGGGFERLESALIERAGSASAAALLARDLHVLPDFNGNRSPWSDPRARGGLVGLGLDDDPAVTYVAAITGLAHGMAQIIAALERDGRRYDMAMVSGGAARSPLVRQIVADATGRTIGVPETPEPVLLGSAMLGAVAAGHHDIGSAMAAMSRMGGEHRPAGGAIAAFHRAKQAAFLELQRCERRLRTIMAEPAPGAPELVIFDCDGVLVESEVISLDETQRALARLGLDLTIGEVRDLFLGISETSVAAVAAERFGVTLPPAFFDDLRAAVMTRFDTELTAVPGIVTALEALAGRVCVASSSRPERIRRSLEVAGLADRFDGAMFSARMVARGKPAPDLFQLAARRLGATPARCLVIEDSVAGVEAAVAAGMAVFGFVGGRHLAGTDQGERLARAGASRIFDDMATLPALAATVFTARRSGR